MENKNFFSNPVVIVFIVVAVLLCCCVILLGAFAFLIPAQVTDGASTDAPSIVTEDAPTPPPTSTREATRAPGEQVSLDTLEKLQAESAPVNDPVEIACRLQGLCNIPLTLPAPVRPLQVGDLQTFWVSDAVTDEYYQVEARLEYITAHSYFWIEQGQPFIYGDLKKLANTFEDKIYPTNRAFFGSEWTPGIDNDARIYILFVEDLGGGVAGYFSAHDVLNPLIQKHSNGHEMFLFDLNGTPLDSGYAYSVLAHEFQHMIHWNQDRNEALWVNEGLADLAALLNGYDSGGNEWLFMGDPDLQLNDWPNEPDDPYARLPHYGASFLYFTYLLDRFGEEVTKAIVRNPLDGFTGIDDTFQSLGLADPQTGRSITAEDVFVDWTLANFLRDDSVGDGRFIYNNYPGSPQAGATEEIFDCSSGPLERSVNQYGADYIRIGCRGDYILRFEGAPRVKVIPADPYSGQYAFWSNKGDVSDMTLTRQFDLSGVSGPVELRYRVWYDLETDYDYVYVETSTDGETWQIVRTPSSTDYNPTGNSYGWGYTGVSNGWLEESLDLSQYVGRTVWVRFEYVTDTGVTGEGLLIDDIAIPAINYEADFESDDGGWEARGFVRMDNILPQTFRVTLIVRGNDTTIRPISLDVQQAADMPLSLARGEEAILVVSGTTRFTRNEAEYAISFK